MPNIRSEKKKKEFQNGPKSFLSRTKLRGSVGNAKQSIFYFRPNADAKVSTIALPVLCTGELKSVFAMRFNAYFSCI